MTTVAVTAAGTYLGKALLERLDAEAGVDRIIGLDVAEPDMPVAKLDFRTADVRDPLLPHALDGADVVVHLIPSADPSLGEDTLFALVVHGTRNVLNAAAKVGARKVVHLSSALVYGAHPDNAIPLREHVPLRANPDFPTAYDLLLAEELVGEFAETHPEIAVAVLRPAAVLGTGADTFVSRHLEGVRLPLVRGLEPTVQFLDVDDLAAAAHLAATGGLTGAFNVAAEGWLMATEVCALLGRKPLWLPENIAVSAARRLWQFGAVGIPPGALQYLMYPWVVDTAKLRAHGWAPARSNREILRDFAAAHHGYVAAGRLRLRRRDLYAGAILMIAGVVGLITVRRRRDRAT